MSENEDKFPKLPQEKEPAEGLETIQISAETPLELEKPLAGVDTSTFSTLHQKIGPVEGGTFTVSLDEVEAHPFTQAALTEALPPTVISDKNPVVESAPQTEDTEPEDLLVVKPAVSPIESVPQTVAASPQKEVITPEQPVVESKQETVSVPPPAKPVRTEKQGTPAEKKPQKQMVPPPNTPQQPSEKPHKRKRRWLWVLAALLALFLITVGGFVPVENIPILRNIAHAMGFTPEQAKKMSFLRALLTWTDKTLGLNGKLSAGPTIEGESRLFSTRPGEEGTATGEEGEDAALKGKMARYTGKTSLFDMRALNELQRSKGRRLDQISGTVLLLPGQKAETRAAMRDTEVTVRTEANRDKGEVYFGSDASAINREFNDGYDSIKTLKKVANPHIADGNPIDWLEQMSSRMMKADTGLMGIDKELKTSVVGWKNENGEVGNNKPLRDLYHAWITSRMSNYTNSIMLKKSLADSSFLGAAIPSHASESLTFGGVRVDTDSLENDQEGWKEYLEFEKNCKEELMATGHGGPMVQNAVDSFNNLFPETNWSGTAPENANFPTSCKGVLNSSYEKSTFFKNTVSVIRKACHDMVDGYKKLETSCKMAVDYVTNRCDSNNIVGDVRAHYQARYTAFQSYCKEKYCKEQEEAYNEAHKNDDPPAPAFVCDASNLTGDNWQNSDNYKESCESGCFSTHNTADQIKAEVGATAEYFPQITKDQQYEDEEHRVKRTITAGIEKNSTR